MRVIHEECGHNLYNIITKDIIIDDNKSMEYMKSIMRILINGDKLFFEFVKEDFFLTNKEIIKYRRQIPQYLKENGKYEVKFAVDESRFRSVGYLPVNEMTYDQIFVLWKYFEMVVFFVPNATFSWDNFDKKLIRTKPEVDVVDFIKKEYTDSVFIKGYDGDNLTFIYGENYNKQLVINALEAIKYF